MKRVITIEIESDITDPIYSFCFKAHSHLEALKATRRINDYNILIQEG